MRLSYNLQGIAKIDDNWSIEYYPPNGKSEQYDTGDQVYESRYKGIPIHGNPTEEAAIRYIKRQIKNGNKRAEKLYLKSKEKK